MRAQGVELLLVGWTGGSPEDVSGTVCEQDDYGAFARNLQLLAELIFIEIERNDTGPELGVCEVAAHGGVVPPAVEGVFLLRDRQQIVIEAAVEAAEGLDGSDPAVDFGGVSGIEGDEQKVAICAEGGGKSDFSLGEVIGGNGGKMCSRRGLLRCKREQRDR